MGHFLLNHFRHVHEKSEHMDDFENFLYILTYILFVCLFIRSLVALYMGRWNLSKTIFILKRGIFYDEDFFSSLWEGYTDRFAR